MKRTLRLLALALALGWAGDYLMMAGLTRPPAGFRHKGR